MNASRRARPTARIARLFIVEALGLGWTLGLALCTSVLFALYELGLPVPTTIGAALLCTAVVLGVGLRRLGLARRADDRTERLVPPPTSPTTPIKQSVSSITLTGSETGQSTICAVSNAAQPGGLGERLMVPIGLGLGLLQVVLSAWMAWRSPLAAFDAWSVWAFKARMFVLDGPRPGYFHDWTTLHTHPDYPLNLPLAEAIVWRAAGSLGPRLASSIGPLCLAALLLLFYAGLSRLYAPVTAALATAALALVPALPLQAAGGDADVPLALYCGGAALYLLLWWRLRRPADAVIMALLAGGAAWTKKEGLTVAIVLLLAYLIGEGLRRGPELAARLKSVVPVVAAWGALPLPWLIFTLLTHPLGRDFLPTTPAVFLAHVGRLTYIVPIFALQMLDIANWSMLWALLIALLALALRRLGGSGYGLLLLLLAQLGAYAVAFVFSDWQPYTAHVQTSLSRLLVQTVPLALLLLVECTATLASFPTVTKRMRPTRAACTRDAAVS